MAKLMTKQIKDFRERFDKVFGKNSIGVLMTVDLKDFISKEIERTRKETRIVGMRALIEGVVEMMENEGMEFVSKAFLQNLPLEKINKEVEEELTLPKN